MTIGGLIGKVQRMLPDFAQVDDAADFVLRDLSQLGLDRIRARHSGSRHLKYVDELERFVRRSMKICRALALDRAPPQRILDIGCGTGLLLHCMQRYGHTGLGIDIPDPFYTDMAIAYGVERRIQAVRPFTPLDLDGQFDLVTAVAVCFDRLYDDQGRRDGTWNASQWRFFLADVESWLTPNGRVYLKLNQTGDEIRPHQAFAAGTGTANRFELLFDRDGLVRTLRALEASPASTA